MRNQELLLAELVAAFDVRAVFAIAKSVEKLTSPKTVAEAQEYAASAQFFKHLGHPENHDMWSVPWGKKFVFWRVESHGAVRDHFFIGITSKLKTPWFVARDAKGVMLDRKTWDTAEQAVADLVNRALLWVNPPIPKVQVGDGVTFREKRRGQMRTGVVTAASCRKSPVGDINVQVSKGFTHRVVHLKGSEVLVVHHKSETGRYKPVTHL